MDADLLEKQAIKAAASGAWEQAIDLNQQLLKNNRKDVPALNRQAKAYWKLGKIDLAKKVYQKALKIDRFNPIADKNLKRLMSHKSAKIPADSLVIPNNTFLEEHGKTKVVSLVRLASPQVLAEVDSGDPVVFNLKKRSICICRGKDGVYLGSLPDDLSLRLISLIKGGNRYQAFAKAISHSTLEIFIREIFRSQKFHNLPSFLGGYEDYQP